MCASEKTYGNEVPDELQKLRVHSCAVGWGNHNAGLGWF